MEMISLFMSYFRSLILLSGFSINKKVNKENNKLDMIMAKNLIEAFVSRVLIKFKMGI